MGQITGRATIRWDGEVLRTDNESTANPTGTEREAVTGGGQVHGFRESDVAPTLSLNVVDDGKMSIKALGDITNATVLFETDTGRRLVFRGAFTTNQPELNVSGGTISVEMSAIEVDEETA